MAQLPFPSDGSFMEMFQKMQGAAQAAGGAGKAEPAAAAATAAERQAPPAGTAAAEAKGGECRGLWMVQPGLY